MDNIFREQLASCGYSGLPWPDIVDSLCRIIWSIYYHQDNKNKTKKIKRTSPPKGGVHESIPALRREVIERKITSRLCLGIRQTKSVSSPAEGEEAFLSQ